MFYTDPFARFYNVMVTRARLVLQVVWEACAKKKRKHVGTSALAAHTR